MRITLLGLGILLSTAAARADYLAFPTGFKWCTATAAHQIEGYNTESDWWDWEQIPGKIRNGETSAVACDHWNRFPLDTLLQKELNVSMYRFSIEWAKIEPREGEWDLAAVLHYKAEIALLRAAGIEPNVTLQHFVLPRWFRAKGGWEWAGAPAAFARYAAFAYEAFGGQVRDWITINEPMVHLLGGYLVGLTPPGKKDLKLAAVAMKGMLRAHGLAYRALHRGAKEAGRDVRVGIAHHLRVFDPDSPHNPLDRLAAKIFDRSFNWAFGVAADTGRLRLKIPFALNVDEIIPDLAGSQDFIGVNYYTRDLVNFNFKPPLGAEVLVHEGSPVTDLGWEIYPEGFYRTLRAAADKFPGRPIIVTENGIADRRDLQRRDYLRDHLAALHRAIRDGVTIEGYCHWSLMDNFEWVEGYEPRFGLYAVDYSNQKRTLRPSGRYFSEIARANGFEY
jgi:beta-glucosidase